ncbi:uncharacterized protein UBRO2_05987 [Ustilago bromivora]|uniref:Uncharacterized protein n=1 Tax=Ustilago bromivora TaxID=307758 RepID=A0A8H8QSH6_9BASI|nr:uncharacterized protein UBRO2_05987 [Ustilago bromivora]
MARTRSYGYKIKGAYAQGARAMRKDFYRRIYDLITRVRGIKIEGAKYSARAGVSA